jgi:hypothetical protein
MIRTQVRLRYPACQGQAAELGDGSRMRYNLGVRYRGPAACPGFMIFRPLSAGRSLQRHSSPGFPVGRHQPSRRLEFGPAHILSCVLLPGFSRAATTRWEAIGKRGYIPRLLSRALPGLFSKGPDCQNRRLLIRPGSGSKPAPADLFPPPNQLMSRGRERP